MLSITAQDREAFLTFKWRKPYFGMKLFISTWIFLRSADFCEGHWSTLWKKQMWGTESREEEILKALEHHQTGKTPTHNRAEKALRSSRASLNGSLWANCTNPHAPSQLATSPRHTNPWALSERVGEQALFLADLFILRWLIHPQSAVISTFRVTFPRPVSLSSASQVSRKTYI